MKTFTVLCGLSLLAGSVYADADWGYSSAHEWGKLSQTYAACNGAYQSPINIDKTIPAIMEPLQFSYNTMIQSIQNNGHTIQVDFSEGGVLYLDRDPFVLKQFHLHSPSENLIKGKSYPLEIHFVHANAKGELAVVGMMYAEGLENPQLARLWQSLPKQKGQRNVLDTPQPVNHMLPKNLQYYRFSGSLTTPPCSEGVRWLIMKEIQHASAKQIRQFSDLMGHPNNRPVQPLNGRIIAEN